jgi:hypothetical protein
MLTQPRSARSAHATSSVVELHLSSEGCCFRGTHSSTILYIMGGLTYGSYGAAGALTIIGLCMSWTTQGWQDGELMGNRHALPRRRRGFQCVPSHSVQGL